MIRLASVFVCLALETSLLAAPMVRIGTHPSATQTSYPQIHNIKAFNGALYFSYGDWNYYPACMLASYDPAANTFRFEYAPGTDSLGVPRELDGVLYATHCDPIHYEDFADYSYLVPGLGWRDATPIGLYHSFDFCKLGDSLFFSGAKDSHEGAPNSSTGNGVLMRSPDGGKNWASVNPTSNGFSRYYWCFTLGGKVYTQGGTFDGTSWTAGSPLSGYSGLYKPTNLPGTSGEFVAALQSRTPGINFSASSTSLLAFNGTTTTTLLSSVRDFAFDGTNLIVLTSTGTLQKASHLATTGVTWTSLSVTDVPSTASCVEILDGRLWVGDATGGIWAARMDGDTMAAPSAPEVVDQMPDGFGRAIAFDGDALVVGAHEFVQTRTSDRVKVPAAGRVHTWLRNTSSLTPSWASTTTIKATNPTISGWFGKDAALDNGVLAVVEAGYDTTLRDRGASARVHLYSGASPNWSVATILSIPFAHSVALDGDLLAVSSANPAANQAAGVPSVYPYRIARPVGGAPTFTALPALVPTANNWGYKPVCRVALNSTWLLAGFSGDISRNGGVGMIALWSRAVIGNTSPAVTQQISTGLPDRFGFSVDLGDTWVGVGAPRDDAAAKQAGAVYLYEITAFSQPLVQRQKITCPVAQAEAAFGTSVALAGNRLLVGAPGVDADGLRGRGAVYVYELVGGTWVAAGELAPPSGNQGGFGIEVNASSAWLAAASRHSLKTGRIQDRLAIVPATTPAPDWSSWAASHGLPAGQDGHGDDPDGDGVSNLMEKACRLDPASPSASLLPESGSATSGLPRHVSRSDGKVYLRYLLTPGDLRFRVSLETSPDLTTWKLQNLPYTVVGGDADTWLVETELPAAAENLYARLRYRQE